MEAQMQMQIPVFDGDDHEIWSIKMRTLLMARDLWDVVESGVSEENKNLKIKDMTALHMLQTSVTDSLFLQIAGATSSKQAWEILKEEYAETEEIRRFKVSNLWSKFIGLMMEKEESFVDYSKKLMELVNQLRFYGSEISDEHIIDKICRSSSLPSKFDSIVSTMLVQDATLTKVVWVLRTMECDYDEHEKREKREASHNHKRRRQ